MSRANEKKSWITPGFLELVKNNLPQYELEDELGHGGMGMVVRAREKTLDRTVALKLLPPALGDEEFQQRFLREARSAAQLDHPNIVQIFAAGQTPDITYIAMQFVEGETLAARMRRERRMPTREALRIAREVALALQAAHHAGIVHRDIKPQNIMIVPDGRVRVMDFGLSLPVEDEAKITKTGTYLGTPEYSSPEQCETRDLDGRSDLYSLGVVLYQMLTGGLPHIAETPLSLFDKIVKESPLPVRKRNPDVPRAVEEVVDSLLKKDPALRLASAGGLVEQLDHLLSHESFPQTQASHPSFAETAIRPPQREGTRRRAALWKGVALVAGLAVLAGLALNWNALFGTSGVPEPQGDSGPAAALLPGADGVLRLVVFDFKNPQASPEDDWMEIAIPEMLIAKLNGCSPFEVVTRDELLLKMSERAQRKLNPSRHEASGDRIALNPQTEAILKEFETEAVVLGSYIVSGGKVQLLARLYRFEAEPCRLVRLQTAQVRRSTGEFFELIDSLAAQLRESFLLKAAELGFSPEQIEETAPALATELMLAALEQEPANEWLSRRERSLERGPGANLRRSRPGLAGGRGLSEKSGLEELAPPAPEVLPTDADVEPKGPPEGGYKVAEDSSEEPDAPDEGLDLGLVFGGEEEGEEGPSQMRQDAQHFSLGGGPAEDEICDDARHALLKILAMQYRAQKMREDSGLISDPAQLREKIQECRILVQEAYQNSANLAEALERLHGTEGIVIQFEDIRVPEESDEEEGTSQEESQTGE